MVLKIISYFLCLFTALFMTSCGIRGNAIAPSEFNKSANKFDLQTLTNKKQTDITDPSNKVVSVGNLLKIGRNYDASFGDNTEELDDLFERLKPDHARLKKAPTQELF